MLKTVQREEHFCDVCGATGCYHPCDGCGKDLCWEHRKTHAVEYSHGVHIGGSGNGIYCLECDNRLIREGDPKHKAYRLIYALRNEEKLWYADFTARSMAAEGELKKLLD